MPSCVSENGSELSVRLSACLDFLHARVLIVCRDGEVYEGRKGEKSVRESDIYDDAGWCKYIMMHEREKKFKIS